MVSSLNLDLFPLNFTNTNMTSEISFNNILPTKNTIASLFNFVGTLLNHGVVAATWFFRNGHFLAYLTLSLSQFFCDSNKKSGISDLLTLI